MSKPITQDHMYGPDAKIGFARGTGTDSSQAVTIHKPRGKITSSTTNLGAKTTQAITLTNRLIKTKSLLLCMLGGGGNGDVVVSKIAITNGQAVITILNADPDNACNALYTIDFLVIADQAQQG